MTMRIKITDAGTIKRTAIQFDMMARRCHSTKEPLIEIAEDMMRIERIIFDSQGRRGGGGWKKLKDETIRKKGVSAILVTEGAKPNYTRMASNRLYRSLTVAGDSNQQLKITNRMILFGTKLPYAAVQAGGSSKRNIPARPFMRFLPSDLTRWNRRVASHILLV